MQLLFASLLVCLFGYLFVSFGSQSFEVKAAHRPRRPETSTFKGTFKLSLQLISVSHFVFLFVSIVVSFVVSLFRLPCCIRVGLPFRLPVRIPVRFLVRRQSGQAPTPAQQIGAYKIPPILICGFCSCPFWYPFSSPMVVVGLPCCFPVGFLFGLICRIPFRFRFRLPFRPT